MINYYQKYLKYKNKYLELKNKNYVYQDGGQISIRAIKNINLFTDPDMEQFMNPIYGLIMANTRYIENIFTLGPIMKTINTSNSNSLVAEYSAVNEICQYINYTYRPADAIVSTSSPLLPRHIGRYVALLYFCKNEHNKGLIDNILTTKTHSSHKYFTDTIKQMKVTLKSSTIRIGNKIPLETNNKNMFHLLLYCLWWKSSSITDFVEYYNGINETFTNIRGIIRDSNYQDIICTLDTFGLYSDEELQITDGTTISDFNIALINTLSVSNFEVIKYKQITIIDNTHLFSDCVETELRNFINILIFDNNRLNIDKLQTFGAIDELIEYYSKYPNFTTQLKDNAKTDWAILLGTHANTDIIFNVTNDEHIPYNIRAELNNFKQLLINLFNRNLPTSTSFDIFQVLVGKSDNLITEINVEKEEKDDIEYDIILIKNINMELQKIYIGPGHMGIEFKSSITNNSNDIDEFELDKKHKDILKLLFNIDELFPEKYLHQALTINKINAIINNDYYNNELKLCILMFALKLERDHNKRILLPQNFADYLKDNNFFTFTEEKEEFFQFLSISLHTLDFMVFIWSKLSLIPELNLIRFKVNDDLETINFTQDIELTDDVHINKYFFNSSTKLKILDLSQLRTLKTIGNWFLWKSGELEQIIFPENCMIESISNHFMNDCKTLQILDLSRLVNLKTIGYHFLTDCTNLKQIIFPEMCMIKHIGNNFAVNCNNLLPINMSLLPHLRNISNNVTTSKFKLASLDI